MTDCFEILKSMENNSAKFIDAFVGLNLSLRMGLRTIKLDPIINSVLNYTHNSYVRQIIHL